MYVRRVCVYVCVCTCVCAQGYEKDPPTLVPDMASVCFEMVPQAALKIVQVSRDVLNSWAVFHSQGTLVGEKSGLSQLIWASAILISSCITQ